MKGIPVDPLQVDEKEGEYMYVFEIAEKDFSEKPTVNWKQRYWQIFPVFCASLVLLVFGITLGWPSPTYPYLLQPTSVIPISLSQSAMTAGFLMLGVSFATPFSFKYHLGPKYGIWISVIPIAVGWTVMLFSKDIYWLLGSRFFVGLGSGYSMGQIKNYIRDLCEPKLCLTLTKLLNFFTFSGVILSYIIGTYLDFRKFCYVPLSISFLLLFILLLLPCTPKDLIINNDNDKAVMLLNYLRGKKDHTSEIKRIETEIEEERTDFHLPLLQNEQLCKQFFKFISLVILQQFLGGPTMIVYCELIFSMSGCLFPEYCAILYSFIFFTSNIFGVFYTTKLNRKYVMISSCICSSFMLLAQIFVLYYRINQNVWPFSSLIILILFNASYCVGIGNLPVTYIPVWFSKRSKLSVTIIFTIVFHMSALVATKLFQVFISAFPFYSGFCMFLFTGILCLIFLIIFVENDPKTNGKLAQSNSVLVWNSKKNQRKGDVLHC